MPEPAQITLRTLSADDLVLPRALARCTACFSAADFVTAGVRPATLRVALLALMTLLVAPDLAVSTMRSPPSTGRPAYVRS